MCGIPALSGLLVRPASTSVSALDRLLQLTFSAFNGCRRTGSLAPPRAQTLPCKLRRCDGVRSLVATLQAPRAQLYTTGNSAVLEPTYLTLRATLAISTFAPVTLKAATSMVDSQSLLDFLERCTFCVCTSCTEPGDTSAVHTTTYRLKRALDLATFFTHLPPPKVDRPVLLAARATPAPLAVGLQAVAGPRARAVLTHLPRKADRPVLLAARATPAPLAVGLQAVAGLRARAVLAHLLCPKADRSVLLAE
jgi:hypothetical protein